MALDIRELRKVYQNGVEALKGVNLQVKSGDFFALLGPNGAGKSTMLNIISSVVTKSSGNVSICGYDMEKRLFDAKIRLGITPQEPNLSYFSNVLEVLIAQAGYFGVAKKQAKHRAEYYLKLLGLWEKRNTRTKELSGGMKRRLMVVRALIHEPELLILDEPTAGLDIESRHLLWEFMNEMNHQGTTIILTTHYLEEAEQLCKNIAIIDKGNILLQSDMKTIIKTMERKTYLLDLTEPLEEAPKMPKGTAVLVDKHTLEVSLKDESINSIFQNLDKLGIEVSNIRNKMNRLEELFLTLTEK